MKKEKSNKANVSDLRKRAEKKLKTDTIPIEKLSEADVRTLAHELQVHQIELEMQNEELRKATTELEESRDRYSKLYNFAPVGYFTVSEKGIILEANLTGAAMLGVEKSDLIDKPLGLFITKEDEDVFYLLRKEVCKKEGKRGTRELRMKRMDGTQFYAQLECKVEQDAGGNNNNTGCMAVMSDITERKQADEELEKYRNHLESLVEGRTRELKDSQEQLIRKEKLAAVGQVSGSIAHELRNPLAVIENSVYFLKEKLKETTDEKVKKHLDIIHNQMWASNEIITKLLDVTKTRTLSPVKLDVNTVVKNILSDFKIMEGITIDTQLDENLPTMVLDPILIQSAFKNIISNSLQAMPEGGSLEIKTKERDNFVEVEIKDTGKGISQEDTQKIFEPLFTTKAKGIGLGLAIVKSIIDEHKGSILVGSDVGKGTTFTVKLPIKE